MRRGTGGLVLASAAAAAGLAAAHAAGFLAEAGAALVAAVVFAGAYLPYVRGMAELAADVDECAADRHALTEIDLDRADGVVAEAAEGGASSVLTLAATAARACLRGGGGGPKAFFAAFDAHWQALLGPIRVVAEVAPVLGLLGSLIAIAAAVRALAAGPGGDDALYDALATMAFTTIAGGAGMLFASELHRRAADRVAAHRADLVFVAGGLTWGEPTAAAAEPPANPLDVLAAAVASPPQPSSKETP